MQDGVTMLLKYVKRVASRIAHGCIEDLLVSDDWRNMMSVSIFRRDNLGHCSICSYRGPFLWHASQQWEVCPHCLARARHRVLALALRSWYPNKSWDRILHLAPEVAVRRIVEGRSREYYSVDLEMKDVSVRLDWTRLPIQSNTIDLLISSHVLEHIMNDEAALHETYRVLTPGGTAILIVPITVVSTEEWGFADAERNHHVRDCGQDYFEKYRQAGFDVQVMTSDDFPDHRQVRLYSHRRGVVTKHWIARCTKRCAG